MNVIQPIDDDMSYSSVKWNKLKQNDFIDIINSQEVEELLISICNNLDNECNEQCIKNCIEDFCDIFGKLVNLV